MKKASFFGVALVALMSAGGAQAQSGHADLSYQNTDAGSTNFGTIAASGAFMLNEHIQLNGHYASLDSGGADEGYWSIDGFLFNRSQGGAYGGYVGFDSFDAGSNNDEWSVGAFGQIFAGNTTWTGQVGYSDTEGNYSVISLDGEARHFVSDNFSIQGNLGYGKLDGIGDPDYWSAGIGAELQFTGAPISVFGGWQHLDIESTEVDHLGIGVRWNFGGGSLLDRDRSGASLSRQTSTFIEIAEVGGTVTPR